MKEQMGRCKAMVRN